MINPCQILIYLSYLFIFLHGTIYFAAYFVYLVFVFWLYHCNKIISICWIRPSVIIHSFDLLHVVSFVVWVFIYLLISTWFSCFDFNMFVCLLILRIIWLKIFYFYITLFDNIDVCWDTVCHRAYPVSKAEISQKILFSLFLYDLHRTVSEFHAVSDFHAVVCLFFYTFVFWVGF